MATKKQRDPEVVAIGQRVRQALQLRHLTLAQLAEAADTSIQFISQIEKGEQCMTVVKFGRLARALGVSMDYLVYGSERRLGTAQVAAEYLAGLNPVDRSMVTKLVLELQGLLDVTAPEG